MPVLSNLMKRVVDGVVATACSSCRSGAAAPGDRRAAGGARCQHEPLQTVADRGAAAAGGGGGRSPPALDARGAQQAGPAWPGLAALLPAEPPPGSGAPRSAGGVPDPAAGRGRRALPILAPPARGPLEELSCGLWSGRSRPRHTTVSFGWGTLQASLQATCSCRSRYRRRSPTNAKSHDPCGRGTRCVAGVSNNALYQSDIRCVALFYFRLCCRVRVRDMPGCRVQRRRELSMSSG